VLWESEDQGEVVWAVSWFPNSKLFIAGIGGEVSKLIVFNDLGRKVTEIENVSTSLYDASVSPDGTKIIAGTGDGHLHIFLVSDGYIIKTYVRGGWGPIKSVAWSPNGSTIAISETSGYLAVYRLEYPETPIATTVYVTITVTTTLTTTKYLTTTRYLTRTYTTTIFKTKTSTTTRTVTTTYLSNVTLTETVTSLVTETYTTSITVTKVKTTAVASEPSLYGIIIAAIILATGVIIAIINLRRG